jgi:hypothetical protein
MAAKTNQNQLDRTPFWGTKTHQELKFIQQVVNNKISQINLDKNCFNELLKGKKKLFDSTKKIIFYI